MNLLTLMKTPETEADPESPRTLDDCPEYLAARDRLGELQLQQTEVRRVLNLTLEERRLQLASSRKQTAAEAIFAGDLADPLAEAPLQKQCADLQGRIRAFDEAISMQRKVVENSYRRASEQIAKTYLPEYKQAVSTLRDALVILRNAALNERIVRGQIESLGIQTVGVITHCPFRQIGDIAFASGDRGCRVQHIDEWLEHAIDADML